MIQLELPKPPTANNLFINLKHGGRAKSSDYKTWEHLAALDLGYHRAPTITGRMKVEYLYGRHKDKRRRDILNLEKALTDFLVKAQVIKDDCLIDDARLAWSDEVPEGRVRITIVELEEEQKCLGI